ncbi:MAG: EAL domain-containing protein [Deltaproteobacteria bacterium]|nr:EAL domain-containing protein [Deltaproteobacteria bacterium]
MEPMNVPMPKTARVPETMASVFRHAEETVGEYFKARVDHPEQGMIEIAGQRYILVRAASLSVEFFGLVRELYGSGREVEADAFARNLLYDLAHAIGRSDAREFHAKMDLEDPIAKLSAGPVHFAYTGWAFVDISPESHTSSDQDFYLLYEHPYSFEAAAWLQRGQRCESAACIMNAGYSSGWCEQSFGLTLAAVEILCRAKGDDCCRFIMAPPSRIEGHIEAYGAARPAFAKHMTGVDIPDFFSRKRLEEELHRIALHDALTNLPNRMLLADRIRQAISLAHRHQQYVAVMLLDLDNFKEVNDSYGHEAGDTLLRAVAARLSHSVRECDTVARLGGDEFVLILGDLADPHRTGLAAERILSELGQPIDVNGHEIWISGSMGIAAFPNDGEDAETLLRHADAAMYHVKRAGRNSYQFFNPQVGETSRVALELDASLHRALEQNEFILHYQPIIDVATGAMTSVEALVRWRLPSGELVPPDQFIPVAERSGLIVPLGQWVLREACRQASSWTAASGRRLSVAVNVSARQLQLPGLVETVLEAIRGAGLDPKLLELELTESSIMRNADETQRTLRALREHGIRIAIDDFGSGYSSLHRLRSLPIDLLKLDRAFVRNVASDPADATLVAAIVALAHDLGLRVVAEGVETEDQLRCLKSLHWKPTPSLQCDLVQGFYFSRPVVAAEIERLLANDAALPRGRYVPAG